MFKNWAKTAEKTADIIDQTVTDKDLANRLKADMYRAELKNRTIPWVDALHKMGRQLLAFGQIGFYAWAASSGIEITPELIAGVSGATGLYTIAKGGGNK